MTLYRHSRRVGQQTDIAGEAGQAAGAAARSEAEKGVWPPQRDQVQAVGAAAGSAAAVAACTIAGAPEAGPLCSAIGKEVGAVVGGALYDLLDSWFGSNDLTRRTLDSYARRAAMQNETCRATIRLAELRALDNPHGGTALPDPDDVCVKTWQDVVDNRVLFSDERTAFESRKLGEWGARLPASMVTDAEFQAGLKSLFVAETARAAEIIAAKRVANPPSTAGKALAVAIVGGLAVGLLQKLIFRN